MFAVLYERYGKRVLDLALASVVLILCLPLMVIVAIAIRLHMGAPVFFLERRAGRGARPFLLWKFRTMTNAVDARGRPLPDRDRVTALGRLLRRTSVDELPELMHVVRGEMSLVGPRPLPVRYVERYSQWQARRLEATPGMTGLAQVSGRNGLTWNEKFALDVWYVDHRCFLLDLRLLLATAAVVITGDGVSQPGHTTMEEFLGSTK